jgi:hypothetical protein
LSAEGLLVPSEHPSNDFLMVPVHRLGTAVESGLLLPPR